MYVFCKDNDTMEGMPRGYLFGFSYQWLTPRAKIYRPCRGYPRMRNILAAVAYDTNPKRQQGSQLITSLALRVSMESVIFDRGQHIMAIHPTFASGKA